MRREALACLLAAMPAARARSRRSLDRFFPSAQGAALLIDAETRAVIATHGEAAAAGELAPPGSALKPFVLAALLQARKLSPEEALPCPGRLAIAGHSFTCSHPPLPRPVRVREALAYSCNCFVAHVATRFEPGELAAYLERMGLAALPALLGAGEVAGRIEPAHGREANQLQALGEQGVLVTTAGLAIAYRGLARLTSRPEMRLIREGLEDAVSVGTAQLAQVPGWSVAGKTGSAVAGDGARIAWFAAFAPSRAPEVVLAVMLQGRSGGSDAAPVAARILAAYRGNEL